MRVIRQIFPQKSQASILGGKVLLCMFSGALLLSSFIGSAHAGELKAIIVEENGGSTGKINWVVINEQDFSPVLAGKGSSIQAELEPGLYLVSVDGDTQGRKSVKIDKGTKSIKVSTRKFY